MAHSVFSTFTAIRDGLAGLAFSWYLRRAVELSNAELALLTELPSLRAGEPFEPTLLTEPPNCWATITETEVNG
ncbi:hypothetical protein MRB53_002505 [Persea americana]|uniref:Uncharacterized protein n=1 Tax=Persea americana TaxID=3435 RepID=A0ACC2MUJ1_PERAE|nr:hypothetical protein MRB53_002505 [Persea americana]